MLIVPTSSTDPSFREIVQLEGQTYGLRFYWNDRTAAWYCDISTADGVAVASGARLSAGWDLYGRIPSPNLPPGRLLIVDLDGNDIDPGRDDLGVRVVVLYATAADVAQAESDADLARAALNGIQIVSIV